MKRKRGRPRGSGGEHRKIIKGHNCKGDYVSIANGTTSQNAMQRIRNTWGMYSYTPQGLIKEFERIREDQDNRTVLAAIDREIDLLRKFVKE